MKKHVSEARVRIQPVDFVTEFARVLWHLRTVLAILFALFAILCAAMFWLGGPVDVLSRAPATLSQAIYFCAITALTIGYGDIVPTTELGRVLSVMLGLLGVLITGLVTAAAVYAVQSAARLAGILPR